MGNSADRVASKFCYNDSVATRLGPGAGSDELGRGVAVGAAGAPPSQLLQPPPPPPPQQLHPPPHELQPRRTNHIDPHELQRPHEPHDPSGADRNQPPQPDHAQVGATATASRHPP